MQSNPVSPPLSLRELVLLGLASVITLTGKTIATWIASLWRKPQATADTEKTRAETRKLDAETVIQTGDAMIELVRQVAEEAVKAGRLRTERDFWQGRAEGLKEELEGVIAERDLLRLQLDKRIRIGDGVDRTEDNC